MPDFVANNIVKQYPTPTEPLEILSGVSVSLERGENAAVIGPSGCGKSTFLQIAGTLDQPTSGSVEVLGKRVDQLDESSLARFRNKHIGFIFQDHHLLPQLSALENVLIPVVAQSAATSESTKRAQELLSKVGLSDRMGHRPAELSGGERQRVAVARALINQPALLLADEPTGSLDPKSADGIGKLLLELQAEQDTMLICVTHSMQLAATFQKRLRLDEGKLIEVDSALV
ncbi:MAG: ABC transporter ATP-binding protein [Planctomycetota bacterium]